MNDHATITIVEKETPEWARGNKYLAKVICLSKKTGEIKKIPGGELVKGKFEVVQAATPQDFVARINELGPKQATMYGVPKDGQQTGRLASRNSARDGELTRTKENFVYPSGPSWMMNDIDTGEMEFEEVISYFRKVIPGFDDIPAVFAHSTSSYIYHGEDCLIGEGGKRLYILVKDGTDIPRAAKVMADRLKIEGTFNYKISKSGALLERCLVDEAVYQPTRLDFSGRPYIHRPLKQMRPGPEVQNNDAAPLDTKTVFPDLSEDEKEKLEFIRQREREKIKPHADEVRETWVSDRVEEWVEKEGKDASSQEKEEMRAEIKKSVENHILHEKFILYPEDEAPITVKEILKDPERWHRKRFADPLEPDYHNDNRIATAYIKGEKTPSIWSFAHGGQRFWLDKEKKVLKYKKGDLPKLVKQSMQILNESGGVFQSGGELVRVADGKKYPMGEAWLRNKLDTNILFRKAKVTKKGTEYPVEDCPKELAMRIRDSAGEWPFYELDKMVDVPVMRKDGSILSTPGYDPATNLILLNGASDFDWEQVMKNTTDDEIKAALERIWEPYRLFPYKTPVDVGVLLAALLTVPVRSALSNAPGVLFRAPVFGSGKTKLATAIAQTTNKNHPVMTWPDERAEQRKALVSELRKSPEVIIYDNITGLWNSSDLAMMLTSQVITDRVLGVSQMIDCKTSCMLFATGNNVVVGGDLARRIMVCDLDPQQERPDQRVFEFDPIDLVEQNTLQIRADVLTVLRAYINAGRPRVKKSSFGSFEEWEGLVRQAVCWIAEKNLFPAEIDDPLDSITANYQDDPNTRRLRAFMENYLDRFGDNSSTAADIVNSTDQFDDNNDMYQILYDIAGQGRNIDTRRLGNWLGKNAERIINGRKIVKRPMRSGNQTWQVVEMDVSGASETFHNYQESDDNSSNNNNDETPTDRATFNEEMMAEDDGIGFAL